MASKRALRRKQCGIKQRYSQEGAQQAMYAARRRTGADIRAYHCHWCGSWHIGHRSRRTLSFARLFRGA